MSEKKQKMEVELKAEDRKLLESVIEATRKPTTTAAPTEHKHEEAKHNHFSVDLEYMEKPDACPECKKGLDNFGKKYMKKTLEERAKLPFECVNCGLGVKEDDDACPNCGGKDAKKR